MTTAVPYPSFVLDDNSRPVIVGNTPDEGETAFLFAFGAYGGDRVLVWADSFEQGFEVASDVALELWPGLASEPDYADAAASAGVVWPAPEGVDPGNDPEYLAVIATAETDMTYTERGWLPSWEWTGHEADPDTVTDRRPNP